LGHLRGELRTNEVTVSHSGFPAQRDAVRVHGRPEAFAAQIEKGQLGVGFVVVLRDVCEERFEARTQSLVPHHLGGVASGLDLKTGAIQGGTDLWGLYKRGAGVREMAWKLEGIGQLIAGFDGMHPEPEYGAQ
jgi:hypothetical protein